MKTNLRHSELDTRDRVDLENETSINNRVGSWTPVLTFATPGDLAVTYGTQVADYVRKREWVVATFRIVTTGFTFTTASGNLQITGLPYTASTRSADSSLIWHGSVIWSGITKAGYTQVNPQISANSSIIQFSASGSGVAAASVMAADMPTGGAVVLRGTLGFRIRT